MESVYRFELQVTPADLDDNRHVNNVVYVQWMQDAAIRHAEATGCAQATEAAGAAWVVRAHRVQYLRPAFAGETLEVSTWVVDFQKVRSLRRYRFVRTSDQAVVAQGETDWVFVDAQTGRPRAIPETIQRLFHLVPDA